MSYEEEGRKLVEKHKKEWLDILEKYKDADNKYHKENPNILDGKAPSYDELEKCRKQFSIDLKMLKEKYNLDTKK